MQLLLIEDDPAMQTTLQRAFERRGIKTTPCGDSTLALEQWVSTQPDVVVLDLTLQGLDGLVVLTQARAQGRNAQTQKDLRFFRLKAHHQIIPALAMVARRLANSSSTNFSNSAPNMSAGNQPLRST